MPRSTQLKAYFAAALAAGLSLASLGTAHGKIRCDGPYQIVSGDKIATPYCEDAYLAYVANTYGSHASAEAVRKSPFYKERLCRFVGHDIRVKDICAGYMPEDNRRF